MLSTRIVSTVYEVSEEDWNTFAESVPYSSYRWYQYGEAVNRQIGNEPRYALVYDGDRLVARATFWIVRHEDIPITNRLAHLLAQNIIQRWPLVVCRAPLASYSGLILPEGTRRQAALEALIVAGEQIADEAGGSTVMYDYATVEGVHWGDEYHPIDWMDPGTQMPIVWETHHDYLRHLKKKRRQDYKRYQREKEELGLTVMTYQHVPNPDEAIPLIQNVLDKYSIHDVPYLQAVLKYVGMTESDWLEVRRDGRLIGCMLMIGDRGVRHLRHLGRDYDYDNIYFLMVDEAIKLAIERDVKLLRAGAKLYEVKRRRGFTREDPTTAMFTTRLPLLNLLAPYVA
ncbi:MAG: hypothetical protein GYB64_06785 [Chloroflexi bacterium]|nr:hypothetical protein [Chloroflexota bacterium]